MGDVLHHVVGHVLFVGERPARRHVHQAEHDHRQKRKGKQETPEAAKDIQRHGHVPREGTAGEFCEIGSANRSDRCPSLQAFSEGSRSPLTPDHRPRRQKASRRGRRRHVVGGGGGPFRLARPRLYPSRGNRRSHRTRPSGRHRRTAGRPRRRTGPRSSNSRARGRACRLVRSTFDGRRRGWRGRALPRSNARWSIPVTRAVASIRPNTRRSRATPRRSARPARRTARPAAGSATGASHGAQFDGIADRAASRPASARRRGSRRSRRSRRSAERRDAVRRPAEPALDRHDLVIQEVEERDRAIPEQMSRGGPR